MEFYEALSGVYDIVFPMSEDTLQFLKKDLEPRSKILDIACGTGNYSIALAKAGHHVDAIDLDETMIQQANEKAQSLYVHFIQGDMTKIREQLQETLYDLIFCIGNSIVHLDNKNMIEKLIQDIFDMLRDGGQMVIQTINYDRIIKYNIDHLPTIEPKGEGITFVRKYFHRNDMGKVDFDTELTIHQGTETHKYHNSIPLLALQKGDLEAMIKKAGFQRVEFYGGFGSMPYALDAYAMVVRAIK
ncbi:ubiquinone/menaquinone biosynthesis C-methylase UbiE [Anaerosolibacter carboniphilus]|uniref:Ubiquinone/menaquinone biosynthesis C-methylase UbiE n=1 Tax=Anaerosolibacter carboniphilus TaxID=1417629 RepID=A0A841L0B5_9FIRM|nr:class I SAM-dependent methyltransferase [Anaerosolibacter carboniphilus]MBB6217650.1 ubiquinone/menaquinone biosynthesis C-methylase UbiE [Anaerosolibacter carboniphilus]